MARLIDVAEITAGQSPKSEYYNSDGIGTPFFQGNADFGTINPKVRIHTTKITKRSYKDDILMSVRAPVGALNINNVECCIGRGLAAIRCKENLNQMYTYYFLHYFRRELKAQANGAIFEAITIDQIKNIEIPSPSLSTQKAIAEKLDKADALRKKDKELLAQYDELAQAIFIDMFGDPVKNEKGWKIDFLKNMTLKIGSGSTPKGGKENYKSEGISLIRSMNVYDRQFLYRDLAYIDENQAEKLKNVIVESGDILFNITGASVCRSSIVPDNVLPARVNQHVSLIRPKLEYLNNHYLSNLLISDNVKQQLLKIGSGGGAVMEAITKEQLENYKIIIPPLNLQIQFAEKIKNIEAQKALVKQQSQQSEDLFQALLQESFNFN